MRVRLGYACLNTALRKEGIFSSRTCRRANFSLQKANDLILRNVRDLVSIIRWNGENGIHLFRVSSDIFPFYDHPDLEYRIDDLVDRDEIFALFGDAALLAKFYEQRLTMHPGPYTVLSAINPQVRKKAVLSLNMHRDILQLLEEPEPIVNIHIGGNFSKERAETFCSEVEKLPLSTRSILTIENDDKPNAWSVRKLWEHIWYWTGVPIVLDTLHWQFCHEEQTMEQDYITARQTFLDARRRPKVHHSESAQGKRPQAHSELIESPLPDFISGDVMFEAKAKQGAVLNYRKKYNDGKSG